MKRIIAAAVFFFSISGGLFGMPKTTCTHGDWDDDICAEPMWADRCDEERVAKKQAKLTCHKNACPPSVGGGCKGELGSNNWFIFTHNGVLYRCACGCFGEETRFETSSGLMSATEINQLARSGNLDITLPTSSNFLEPESQHAEIFQVTAGKEKDLVFLIVLENNKKIVLTGSHPVVTHNNDSNKPVRMVRAEFLSVGDILADRNNNPVKIVDIQRVSYTSQVVNFRVNSRSGILFPEGLKMGDLAWQNYLARFHQGILTIGDITSALERKSR